MWSVFIRARLCSTPARILSRVKTCGLRWPRGARARHPQAATFAREIIFRAPICNVAANTFFAYAIINRGINIINADVRRGMENGFCLGLCDVSPRGASRSSMAP